MNRDPQAFAEAFLRPPRGQILTAVGERPDVSVREVALRLGLSPRRVRHHLDALARSGLVSVASAGGGSRTLARRYRAERVTFEESGLLSTEMRAAISKDAVRLLLRDIAVAAAAGTFATDPDDHMIRTYGEVDDACIDDLAALHWSAYREMMAAVEAGRGRVAASGRPGTEVVTSVFFFEAPIWRHGVPKRPRSSAPDIEAAMPDLAPLDPDRPDLNSLADAFTRPPRSRVLVALSERPGVSIRELAGRLGESPRRVRHHVEALVELGLATVTAEELRPGVLERRFGSGTLLIEDTLVFPPATRVAFGREILALVLDDISTADAAGTLGRRRDEFGVRIYGEVDDICVRRLADIHRRAHPLILAAVEAGRRRVRRRGEVGTEVVSALLLFGAPVWRGSR